MIINKNHIMNVIYSFKMTFRGQEDEWFVQGNPEDNHFGFYAKADIVGYFRVSGML